MYDHIDVVLLKKVSLWFWEAEVLSSDSQNIYPPGTILVLHESEFATDPIRLDLFEGMIERLPVKEYKVKPVYNSRSTRRARRDPEKVKKQFQNFLEGLLIFLVVLVVIFILNRYLGLA